MGRFDLAIDALRELLLAERLDVRTGVRITRFALTDGGVEAHLTGGDRITAARVLIATGRRPSTAGLGLEQVGVRTGDRGEVLTDDRLRTDNPRIWAAGDVTGAPQFVYLAAAHGTAVVHNAFGGSPRAVDTRTLPRVTFTDPSVAAVGMTEAEAKAAGIDGTSRVLRLEHVPRAIVSRDTRGLVKLVAETGTGRLLGAHILAANGGDVILAAVYAMQSG